MSTKIRNFITATAIVTIIVSVIYFTIASILKHRDYVIKHAASYVISFAIRNDEPNYAASISHKTPDNKSIDLELRGVDTKWLTSIVEDKQLTKSEQKEIQHKLDLNTSNITIDVDFVTTVERSERRRTSTGKTHVDYTAHWTEVVDQQNYILKP